MSLTDSSRDEDILAALDASLRDHVRRDGVDPLRDRSVLRQLAERLVRDHDERSLTGAVLPVADPASVVESLVANVAGFGPLQPYLDDARVANRLRWAAEVVDDLARTATSGPHSTA